MDSDLNVESRGRIEGTIADPIGSSIEERKDEAAERLLDSVSGECDNDVKMSALASSGCSGGMISEVDGYSFNGKEGIVESALNFSSRCENRENNGAFGFSDIKEKQEMAGTLLESEGNGKEAKIFQIFSVFKEEKDFEIRETLESSAEVHEQNVLGHEVKHSDSSLNDERIIDEVNDILDSVDQSQISADKRNLMKPEIGSISGAQSDEIRIFSSDHAGEVTKDSSEKPQITVQEVQNADEVLSSTGRSGRCISEITVVQYIAESNPDKGIVCEESEDRVENCLRSKADRCSSFVSDVDNGCGKKEREFEAVGKQRKGSSSVNTKQLLIEKKEKRSKKRVKSTKKVSETTGNVNLCLNKSIRSKRTYSRKEMEALRYVSVEEQQNMWNKIYLGLGAAVSRELDNMADPKLQNHSHKNVDYHQNFGKKICNGPILRKECSQIVDHDFEGHISGKAGSQSLKDNFKEVNLLYLAGEDEGDGEYADCTSVEEDCDEDSDSDVEYNGIQKPAFLVEGDPNFESGPPEDGLEYLRRVRWEAKHIPKVTVAQVDKSKVSNEQTVYMPKIPDIAKCPEHLVPSKEWEDEFLADFLELRLTLSQYESSNQRSTCNLQPHLCNNEVGSFSSDPNLSVVLGMDHVSRALLLKNCIRSLESKSALPRNDCAWLFALCAAVDTPLDANMAASMRALLRQCSSLLAEKSEFDDEVVMLNILVTISGRYFKQSEN